MAEIGSLNTRVSAVHAKLRRGEAGLKAVFHVRHANGVMHWEVFDVDTVRGGRMIKDFPHYLVGIYTQDCPIDWLYADMEHEERRRRGESREVACRR